MNIQISNLPGTTAAQAQFVRLNKKLTTLSAQLNRLSERASASHDDNAKKLISRARANTITALSLVQAVDQIAGQSALDLLTTTDNDVQLNVAISAFDDVPDINTLKLLARNAVPVVLQDTLPSEAPDGLDLDQPKRFTCCCPDPEKWFRNDSKDTDGKATATDDKQPTGANTCEQPSYLMLSVPVGISTSTERVDTFLKLGDTLATVAKTQMGQARESICHMAGEDSCSLF